MTRARRGEEQERRLDTGTLSCLLAVERTAELIHGSEPGKSAEERAGFEASPMTP